MYCLKITCSNTLVYIGKNILNAGNVFILLFEDMAVGHISLIVSVLSQFFTLH
jgi:hypothetical protein